MIVARQAKHLIKAAPSAPQQVNVNYNVQGNNARVTVAGVDASTNTVQQAPELFAEIRAAVEQGIADAEARRAVQESVEALESAQGSPSFLDRYKEFMGLAANHATVLGPFLQPLAGLLG